MAPGRDRPRLLTPFTIAAVYAVAGCAWIFFSDQLLLHVGRMSLEQLSRIQTVKGLGYVLATSLLLYLLVAGALRRVERSRRALETSEARYRQMFEGTAAIVFILDSETGTLLEANPAASAFYGRPHRDLVGSNITSINRRNLELVREDMRAARAGSQRVFQSRHCVADGSVRDVEVHSTPIDFGGRPALYVIIHDVTQRREAERRLEDSERRYRRLMEEASDAIILLTTQGVILQVNAQACRLLERDREDLVGRSAAELIAPDDLERLPLTLDQIRGDDRRLVERVLLRPDGSQVTAEINSTLAEDGVVQSILRDITERRRLESELRAAQRMEAVGQLTAGIAHDFNNLLTVVLADADLLAQGMSQSDPELQRIVDDLKTSARRGSSMIRKLLSFSRHSKLAPVPLDLGRVVENLGDTLRRLLPENLTIEIVDECRGRAVLADPGAVEQILLNLATNARDAMPGGGTLRIRAAVEALVPSPERPYREPGMYGCLHVRDTGEGMDPAVLARAFEPFFTTKPPTEGSGLGLSMIYGLAKQHRGYVEMESVPGSGTSVAVYFPLAGHAAHPGSTGAPLSTGEVQGKGETLLLVEDEPALRRAGERILRRLGYQVVTAGDGQEALRIIQSGEPRLNLVISDVVMPRLSGWQLYEEVKKAGLRLPFLFTSGYAPGQGDLGQFPEWASLPFIQKPWTWDELAGRVREVLSSAP